MNIGIVGLGLIGGCLGFDFKALGHHVYGIARRVETCEQALSRSVVDAASTDITALKSCEIVFVCTPIATIVPTVAVLANVLEPSAIITDVGSVKAAIVEAATAKWAQFVGGHPMSGKSEAGLAVAEPGIFQNRPYVLTPVEQTNVAAIAIVEDLAKQLHSQVYRCSPTAHDRAVAWISHLPVMVSSGLIQSALHEPDTGVRKLAQQLASSGFRDTSRVGGGNPELGLMMAQYNRTEMIRALKRYQQTIEQTLMQLEAEDWPAIAQQLQETQAARPAFVDE